MSIRNKHTRLEKLAIKRGKYELIYKIVTIIINNNKIISLCKYWTPVEYSSNWISTAKDVTRNQAKQAVPRIQAKTAKIKYRVPILLALVQLNQAIFVIIPDPYQYLAFYHQSLLVQG
jgi:hypothetical protein